LIAEPRKCLICKYNVSEQAKYCSNCGVRLVSKLIDGIIDRHVEAKIAEKITTEDNIVRSISDKIEDTVYRRIKILVYPVSIIVTIITLLCGFFGYKTYEPIYGYLQNTYVNAKKANTTSLKAAETAESALKSAKKQIQDVASLQRSIVLLSNQVEVIRAERSDEDLEAALPGLGIKKGVYLNGNIFQNYEKKNIVLVYMNADSQSRYSVSKIREIKKNIEAKGMSVVFGAFTQSKFGSVSFLNNLVYSARGSSTLYFKKEYTDLAKFIQSQFSENANFYQDPVFISTEQNTSISTDQNYIIKNANIAISVEIY